MASRLILAKPLVTEGRSLQIKGNGAVIGFERLDLLHNNVHHAEDGIGIYAVFIGQQSDTVKGAIDDTVAVYDKEFFHDTNSPP